MGLFHVFQGGCDSADGCDDTAPQDGPSRANMGTPGDLNSCPAKTQCNGNGKQNVKNFVSNMHVGESTANLKCRWTIVIARKNSRRVRVGGWILLSPLDGKGERFKAK